MLIWPIQEGITHDFPLQENKKATIEVLVDDHNAIINEPVESIEKKYGLEKSIEVITKHLLIEINNKRIKAKANKLNINPKLKKAAQAFAEFLSKNHDMYFDMYGGMLRDAHVQYNPDGTVWDTWDRLNNVWYKNYTRTGEIVGNNKLTIKEVVDARMKSTSHRESMLNPKFLEVGIGFSFEKKMWVVDFATTK